MTLSRAAGCSFVASSHADESVIAPPKPSIRWYVWVSSTSIVGVTTRDADRLATDATQERAGDMKRRVGCRATRLERSAVVR